MLKIDGYRMNRLITVDDLIDIFIKGRQRGFDFIISKFSLNNRNRTKSAFSESAKDSSNWWIIPAVRKRWNYLITGKATVNYKEFLVQEMLKEKTDLKMLSLGSGSCETEMELARYTNFKTITCVDLSEYGLSVASKLARQKGLNKLEFICSDISDYVFPKKYFDVVLFNSSLHHFKNVENLISQKILRSLTDDGILVINEYVGPNRLQFPKKQIQEVNKAIKIIPKKFRKRYKTNLYKNFFTGYGVLRMIVADPSECVDSNSILPSIHKYFDPLIEKSYGGNILMNALKDISHHFIKINGDKEKLLEKLFLFEDEYLKNHSSDFVFGVYKKKLLPILGTKEESHP